MKLAGFAIVLGVAACGMPSNWREVEQGLGPTLDDGGIVVLDDGMIVVTDDGASPPMDVPTEGGGSDAPLPPMDAPMDGGMGSDGGIGPDAGDGGIGSDGGIGPDAGDGGIGSDGGLPPDAWVPPDDSALPPDGPGAADDAGVDAPGPHPTGNPALDHTSFYACSAGTATGGAPLLVVLAGLVLRRRRR